MNLDDRLARIEDKLDALAGELHSVVVDQSQRITKVEVQQKGFVAVSLALMTSIVTYLFNLVVK